MAIKDLVRWNNNSREVGFPRGTDVHPFFTLHRELNRMFDDAFRGFDLTPFGPIFRATDGLGWPQNGVLTLRCQSPRKRRATSAELP